MNEWDWSDLAQQEVDTQLDRHVSVANMINVAYLNGAARGRRAGAEEVIESLSAWVEHKKCSTQ